MLVLLENPDASGGAREIKGQVTITVQEFDFRQSTQLLIKANLPKGVSFDLRYTLDGSDPNASSSKTDGKMSISNRSRSIP